MKKVIFEHAELNVNNKVAATGKSIAIVCSKVSNVLSGTRLAAPSDGGEYDYCTIYMDNGLAFYVCGEAERVLDWLGYETE